jgi:hypothetical protein
MLDAAVALTLSAKQRERSGPDAGVPESVNPYLSESIGAVILAACFLESAVNELLLHAVHGSKQFYPGWKPEEFQLMGEFWNQLEDQRAPSLRKAQVALLVARREGFAKGSDPCQAAGNLVRLRNALAHYKPEWSDQLDVHADLEARLKGKFPESHGSTPNQVYFPHRCLGSGCAEWACRTAAGFIVEFTSRLGAESHKTRGVASAMARFGAA